MHPVQHQSSFRKLHKMLLHVVSPVDEMLFHASVPSCTQSITTHIICTHLMAITSSVSQYQNVKFSWICCSRRWWRCGWFQLELWRHAMIQSNQCHQHSDTQVFLRARCPSCRHIKNVKEQHTSNNTKTARKEAWLLHLVGVEGLLHRQG